MLDTDANNEVDDQFTLAYLLRSSDKLAECGEKVWSRIIWDVTAVGYLVDERFMALRLEPCPIPEYDGYYGISRQRHLYVRVCIPYFQGQAVRRSV